MLTSLFLQAHSVLASFLSAPETGRETLSSKEKVRRRKSRKKNPKKVCYHIIFSSVSPSVASLTKNSIIILSFYSTLLMTKLP